MGQPILRSGDSECECQAIEPRSTYHRGSLRRLRVRGPRRIIRYGEEDSILPGSKNRANAYEGSPGTWEACSSPRRTRLGSADTETSGPPAGHPGPRGAKRWRQRVVPTGDTNKPGGTEGQESERLGSTAEAGEPISTGSGGGKGDVESSNRWRETWQRHRTLGTRSRNDSGSPSWRGNRRRWGSRL